MTWREYTSLFLMAFSVAAVVFAEGFRRRRERADSELRQRQEAKDRRDRDERKVAIYNILRETDEGEGVSAAYISHQLAERGIYLGIAGTQAILEDMISDLSVKMNREGYGSRLPQLYSIYPRSR